ncbi:MAG: hypothetical protein HY722_06145 [Planctomycetes bacterium]|nr:hypothetical protein [Planctomycetota bacterium]
MPAPLPRASGDLDDGLRWAEAGEGVDVAPTRGGDLQLRVVALDRLSGHPISGARMLLNGAPHDLPAELHSLKETRYYLEVEAPGYLWVKRRVVMDRPRDGQELQVCLEPAYWLVRWVAVDAHGAPLPHLKVRLHVDDPDGAVDGHHVLEVAESGPDGLYELKVPPLPGRGPAAPPAGGRGPGAPGPPDGGRPHPP